MRRMEFEQWFSMFNVLIDCLTSFLAKIKVSLREKHTCRSSASIGKHLQHIDSTLQSIFAAVAGKDDWFRFFDDPS